MPYMYGGYDGGYGGNSILFFALLVVMLLGFIAQARVQGVIDGAYLTKALWLYRAGACAGRV